VALSDLTSVATGTTRALKWTIATRFGNAIMVKWRPTASKSMSWASASMVQVADTATTYTITGLADVAYDYQVTQVDYGTSQTVSDSQPPAVAAVPVNTGLPVIATEDGAS
jgi:hypothetical protein